MTTRVCRIVVLGPFNSDNRKLLLLVTFFPISDDYLCAVEDFQMKSVYKNIRYQESLFIFLKKCNPLRRHNPAPMTVTKNVTGLDLFHSKPQGK